MQPPWSEPIIELVAHRFRVLGEPMRIKLLMRLQSGAATVLQLATEFGTSQQNVSKHLGVLHRAGVVSRAKEGTFVRYTMVDQSVFQLCEVVCGRLHQQTADLGRLLAPHHTAARSRAVGARRGPAMRGVSVRRRDNNL